MSKRLSAVLASIALTCSLGLVACGGEPADSASDAQKEEKTTQVEPEPEDPAEKFVGTWKLAKVESSGLTMTGSMENIFGTESGMALTIAEDGTGSLTYGDEEGSITWELKDDGAITITPVREDDDEDDLEDIPVMDATYREDDKSLELKMTDDGEEMLLTFTTDGSLADLPDFDLSKATAITSIDQITGEWKLSGVGMAGMVAFGDASTLNDMMGDAFDPSLTINADGTTTMDDNAGTITIDENGAAIGDTYSTVPLKLLGDDLVLDMSDLMDIELFMVYTK